MKDLIETAAEDSFPEDGRLWNDIANVHPAYSVFLSHTWLSTWWKHFGRNRRALTLFAKKNDKVIGIAPLSRSKIAIKGVPVFKTISFVGGMETTYRDFLYEPDHAKDVIKAFFEYLLFKENDWDILQLWNIREDSPSNELLSEFCKQFSLPLIRPDGVKAPFAKLPQSYEVYLNSLKRSVRQNVRRYQNRLRNSYRTRYVEISNPVERDIELFIDLHQKRWNADGEPGIFNKREVRGFYQDILLRLSASNQHIIYGISTNDKPVAMCSRFLYGKTMHAFLEGWDPQFRDYGLGKLVDVLSIKGAIEMGFQEFDFSIGNYDYKHEYVTWVRTNQNYIIFKSKLKMKEYQLISKLDKLVLGG
jgi:hypothetical protein